MLCVLFLLLALSAPGRAERCAGLTEWKEICCDDGECYRNDYPFDGMSLPCCQNEAEDVEHRLFTRENRRHYRRVISGERLPAEFRASRPTVIVTHGWYGSADTPWVLDIKDALLDRADYNVLVIQWKRGARKLIFSRAAATTRVAGKIMADVLKHVATSGGAHFRDMWCIGHSLGAHVCGHAGMRLQGKIGRITALDAAGPYFESVESLKVGLNPSSAVLVDVVHTDTKSSVNTFGTTRPIGHADFYPNGLGTQPGCWDRRRRRSAPAAMATADLATGDLATENLAAEEGAVGADDIEPYAGEPFACSHGRSVFLFLQSIKRDCFVARARCTNVKDMPGSCTECPGGMCARMGYAAGDAPHGIYYLETGGKEPFCLG